MVVKNYVEKYLLPSANCLQVNGSSTSAAEDSMRAFQEVHLEAPPSSSSPESAAPADERGERMKGEISMLSPSGAPPPSSSEIAPTHGAVGDGGAGAAEGGAKGGAQGSARPEDLDIKPFVQSKPLPVPTPSREATLTQKLEQVKKQTSYR